MKRYQVVGFEDTGPVFWFTVTGDNFSEALRAIEKDYYMTDMTFLQVGNKRGGKWHQNLERGQKKAK